MGFLYADYMPQYNPLGTKIIAICDQCWFQGFIDSDHFETRHQCDGIKSEFSVAHVDMNIERGAWVWRDGGPSPSLGFEITPLWGA